MSGWNDAMSRRQRRYERKSHGWKAQSGLRAPEWQCAACRTRSFLSRDTCRGCSKQRDMKQDEYINEWSQSVAYPQQGGCPSRNSSGEAAHPGNKPKGPAQALALARQQLEQARASALPEACFRTLENEVQQQKTAMKQAQPLGQKMDQARARFRRAVESEEKAMQALQKAQKNFEEAQQEVMQAKTDLDLLVQEAPLSVMPVPQVNVSLVRTLEALTGIIENLWTADAGQPPEHLTHAIQESRQILQTSSAIMSQEGGAALDAEFDTGQDPELWDLEEDEVEEMADFEEAHAPGGPAVETTVLRARKAATGNTPITPPPKKTRIAAPADAAQMEPSPRRPKGYQREP